MPKWIKASERLPEIRGRYYVKMKRGGKTATTFDPRPIYAGSNWDSNDIIEWLDENNSPCPLRWVSANNKLPNGYEELYLKTTMHPFPIIGYYSKNENEFYLRLANSDGEIEGEYVHVDKVQWLDESTLVDEDVLFEEVYDFVDKLKYAAGLDYHEEFTRIKDELKQHYSITRNVTPK